MRKTYKINQEVKASFLGGMRKSALDAGRVITALFPSTIPDTTKFAIEVSSEDPKKKDEKDNKAEGSSKLTKDSKKKDSKDATEGGGEELVRSLGVFIQRKLMSG